MLHISQRNLFIVKRNFKIQEKHSLLIYLSNSIYIELFYPIYMYFQKMLISLKESRRPIHVLSLLTPIN